VEKLVIKVWSVNFDFSQWAG